MLGRSTRSTIFNSLFEVYLHHHFVRPNQTDLEIIWNNYDLSLVALLGTNRCTNHESLPAATHPQWRHSRCSPPDSAPEVTRYFSIRDRCLHPRLGRHNPSAKREGTTKKMEVLYMTRLLNEDSSRGLSSASDHPLYKCALQAFRTDLGFFFLSFCQDCF